MAIGEDGKYHYCYKTVNLLSGRYYVGKHSTTDLNDGYVGSGVELCADIDSIGVNNFETTILGFFNTPDEAYKYESSIVTKELVEDPNSYNLIVGGYGGFDHINHGPNKQIYRSRWKESMDSKTQEEKDEINRKKSLPGELNGMFGRDRSGELNPRYGVVVEPETASKISNSLVEYYKHHDNPRLGHKNAEHVNAAVAEANSKIWSFLTPEGTIFRFKNLESFCRDRGLNPVCMGRVHKGEQRQHKGWRKYEGE